MNALVITEGISSTFYFHLSKAEEPTMALCGAKTMPTMMGLSSWAKTSHLNERWCSRCEVQSVNLQPVTDKVQETKKRT